MSLNRSIALFKANLLLSTFVFSGCVASQPLVLTQPVGPARVVAGSFPTIGALVVYSAWDGLDTLDTEHQKHTPYTVRSQPQGNVFHVANQRGSFGQEPESVALPPGTYRIRAHATNVGAVEVSVVIRAGETTVVYLDGVTGPPALRQTRETDWIRQPNGLIVGHKATASAK